ncbi:MAG TPA: type II secretion system protein [Tepidisphaeraceae bacterium]|jgi:prepilin-type N-terminal cleavage/methylation domain-containing protein/prepilin-type processing-associated H-X9-DG protein
MRKRAFTLVELLVVIGIVALLISILLPVLSSARQAGQRVKCLSNLRSMQVAQALYVAENRGYLVHSGFGHGGAHTDAEIAWFNVLQRYGSNKLLPRCPGDDSPHWPENGTVVPNSSGRFRMTSYGVNNYLDPAVCPSGGPYTKITQIRRSSSTIQFLEMTRFGDFAGADHPHVESWVGNVPAAAAKHLQIDAHGGPVKSWESRANYGFVDGHAETLRFGEVYRSIVTNKFDPAVAQ